MRLIPVLLLLCARCFASDIIIDKDTTLTGLWSIPANTVVHFTSSGHVSGSGTINGGIIDAGLYQDIFDTSLSVHNFRTYYGWFSAAWFGFKEGDANNSGRLMRAIAACYNVAWLRIPRGFYNCDRPILIASIYNGNYVGVTLHISGESSFWDSGNGTTLNFTSTDPATYGLGLQLNKGSEVDHLIIAGQWASPPAVTDSAYFNTTFANYNDVNNVYGDTYSGLVIDPNLNQNGGYSGSTGLKIHDMIIKNFARLISISPNDHTLNADILNFTDIQGGDGKVMFWSTGGQEKGNYIKNMCNWGLIHTFFSSGNTPRSQGGGYHIEGGNIAGKCVLLFNINSSGWQQISVGGGFFAESFGAVGNVYTFQTCHFSDCTFDITYPIYAKTNLPIVRSNNAGVMFDNCNFRYFGQGYSMPFWGDATFLNCYLSGPYLQVGDGKRLSVNLPIGLNIRGMP